ncbi:MAG: serine hydrolase domain-containing protein [Alphaproteobacteria bacterium]
MTTMPNPDLALGTAALPGWNQPERRRRSFHALYKMFRYARSYRSPRVLVLKRDLDWRIGQLDRVRALTSTPFFSAMAVAQGDRLLWEAYAPDYGPEGAHSIQSITKTTVNLIVGRLVEDGRLDLARKVGDVLPEIGSGYAQATIQQVLDMDVVNDFTEDYALLDCASYRQEAAMGWRLPPEGEAEPSSRSFVTSITGADPGNPTGVVQYKSANTDVVAWIAERVGGRPLGDLVLEIAEAAGFEGTFHMGTDRAGVPQLNGSGCLCARDLARYGLLFARQGVGVNGERVGSPAFIAATRSGRGTRYEGAREGIRYANHMATGGRWVGHGGYGGQYLLVDLETGVAVAFFSVLEDRDAWDPDYSIAAIRMCEAVASMAWS